MYVMPAHQIPKEKSGPSDELGMQLRRRMHEVGMSQGDLAEAVGRSQGWVSQYLFRDAKKTLKHLWINEPEVFEKLARALQWDESVLLAKIGVATSASLEPVGRIVRLPHLGNVNAGFCEDEAEPPYGHYVDVLEDYLEGSDAANCFTLTVTGDSMMCEDARRTIPEGVKVIIDRSLEPANNDLVVCEIEHEGKRTCVLKVYRRNERFTVLESYNKKHRDVVLEGDMNVRLIGVYVNHIPPGRRGRRALT